MKNIRILTLSMIALATTLSAGAQNMGDLLRFSQYNYSLSTARSAAMGGAFTSLGADLSSMSINPAGLGMYRGSEISFSPSVGISSMKSTYAGLQSGENKSKFSVGNLGVALNLYQGSGTLTSFTLGIGYNKLVDFNSSGRAFRAGSDVSMLDYFAHNLTSGGYNNSEIYDIEDFRYLPLDAWGGALGYQTGLIRNAPGSTNRYENILGGGTLLNQTLFNSMKGSVGEYSVSAGFNFGNKIYFGATIGLQDVYYENANILYEDVASNQSSEDLYGYSYQKTLIMSGTGINGKFGAVVRPIEALRIGVAVHTPTFVNMEHKYIERIITSFRNKGDNKDYESAPIVNDYDLLSPTRLLAGISYTFPIGIVSFDYESVWYNGNKIKNFGDRSFEDATNNFMKDVLKQSNNFRAGVEITPYRGIFLRGGYGYYDKAAKEDLIATNQADIKSYQTYSGGLGFRFSNISLDLAYVNTQYKYLDYELFPQAIDGTGQVLFESGLVNTKQARHTITATMAVRF